MRRRKDTQESDSIRFRSKQVRISPVCGGKGSPTINSHKLFRQTAYSLLSVFAGFACVFRACSLTLLRGNSIGLRCLHESYILCRPKVVKHLQRRKKALLTVRVSGQSSSSFCAETARTEKANDALRKKGFLSRSLKTLQMLP